MPDVARTGQHVYTRSELQGLLDPCTGRTLGEVDSADLFFAVDPVRNPRHKQKIKGIIGDVIEQSVLGYPADSDQRPDLLVDGEDVELKTTGLRESKRDDGWEAKEPMSVTAVSIASIAGEEFETSSFWHKVRRLLIVYYHYEAEMAVLSIRYRDFHLLGYQFHEFDDDEVETLRNDWQLVRDFIAAAQAALAGTELEERYGMLGRELRPRLMMIDTSPRYPNPPRFRLKRTTVTVMARKRFGDTRYIELPRAYTTMGDVDAELRRQASRHAGKTLEELCAELGYTSRSKHLAERLLARMFGAAGRASEIELFAKAGIRVKTACLVGGGLPAEDTKFYTIDFGEFGDPSLGFEDSEMYRYFSESQFVFMLFDEERARSGPAGKRFVGFKRVVVPEEVIERELRSCFETTLDLVANRKLRFVPTLDSEGRPRMNRSGTVMGAPNFPKSSDCQVFVKGTGSDARSRREVVPGVMMYAQQVWWGKKLTKRLLDAAPWV